MHLISTADLTYSMWYHDWYTRFRFLGQSWVHVETTEVKANFTTVDQGDISCGHMVKHLKQTFKIINISFQAEVMHIYVHKNINL